MKCHRCIVNANSKHRSCNMHWLVSSDGSSHQTTYCTVWSRSHTPPHKALQCQNDPSHELSVLRTRLSSLNLRRLSFSSRRCTDLEQSSAAYICSVTSCLALAWRHTSSNSVTRNYCCSAREVTLSFMDTLIALTYLPLWWQLETSSRLLPSHFLPSPKQMIASGTIQQ